jgi:RimJ/RimL family protein N-acetyltransferase
VSETITIKRAEDADWPAVWRMLQPVFRSGDTYAVDRDVSEQEARRIWMGPKVRAYIACDDAADVLGTYYLKANFAGPASGVANCGYIVSAEARGRGLAAVMCRHSQSEAISAGFHAMQFNCVVAENRQAIRIWSREGFKTVGTLERAFDHPVLGRVDALIMYKQLDQEGAEDTDG